MSDHEHPHAPAVVAKGGKSLKALMTRKVGPLPVGLWILGIGGGLAVAAYLRRHPGGSSTDPEALDAAYLPPTDGTGGASVSDPYSGGGASGGGMGDAYDPYGLDLPADDAGDLADVADDVSAPDNPIRPGVAKNKPAKTNKAWQQAATQAAMRAGFPGILSSRAIARFLAGKHLTARQRAAVNAALAHAGPPPSAPAQQPQDAGHADDKPATNDTWQSKAVKALTAGGWNHDAVQEALRRFLHGQPLNAAQRAIVDRALARFGSPPQHVPPSPHGASVTNAAAHGPGLAANTVQKRDTGANAHATATARAPGTAVWVPPAKTPAPPQLVPAPPTPAPGHKPDDKKHPPKGHPSPPRVPKKGK